MSGSRRQRDSIAPSLFPFLAVLLCTMGSLVLILMLVVSGAQASAKQVEQASRHRAEALEATIDLARISYRRQLEDGRIDLEKKRLALQHFEQHIGELLAELADLEKTAQLLGEKSTTSVEELKNLDDSISELEKQLAEASQKLKQQVAKPDGDKPIFAIIPYEGAHGTHRRPIYLECVEQGIIIQPEGVLITTEDLQPPHGPGNPLDAALRTVRTEFAPKNGAVTRTAYPLLVVRPSGVRNYSLARGAMSGWDDQFGYELIDEELELTFPDSKPGLQAKIVQSIELARQRQAAMVMAMPRKYRAFADGFGGESGGDGSGRLGEGQARTGDRLGTLRDGFGQGDLDDGSLGGGSGGGAYRTGGISGRAGTGTDDWEAAMANTANASMLGDLPLGKNSSPGYAGPENGGMGTALGENLGYGQGESNDYSAAGTNSSQAGSPSEYFSGDPTGSAGGSSFFGEVNMASNAGSTGGAAQSGTAQSGTAQANGGASGMAGSQAGSQSNQNGPAGQQAGNQMSAGRPNGGQGGQPGATSSSLAAGDSSASGSSFSVPNLPGMAGAPQPAMPELSMQNRRRTESAAPVAQARGRNWAWSRGPVTQTPVVRPVHLHCFSDRWVLLPDDGNPQQALTIDFESTPRKRAEQLALAVLDRVDSWGLALTGGYWKPIIVVDVAPDAAWRFDQLVQLLEGSGLEIKLRERNNGRK